MRKHVKPALPRAVILDPERGKRLPPQGALVAWTHYWAALEARGDVEVVEEAVDVAPPAEPDPSEPVEPEPASSEPTAQPEAHG